MGYYEQIGADNIRRRKELAKLPRFHWCRIDWWFTAIIWGQLAFWAWAAWIIWHRP